MKVNRIARIFLITVFIMQIISTDSIKVRAEETAVPFNPYDGYTAVTNTEELDGIRNNLTSKYYLANDIEFSDADFEVGGAFYNDGNGWIPIGDISHPFSGELDGKNFSIKGMKTPEDCDFFDNALFKINTGHIQRLSLNVDFEYANEMNAAITFFDQSALCTNNKGIISNCDVSGEIDLTLRIGQGSVYSGPMPRFAGITAVNDGTVHQCSSSLGISYRIDGHRDGYYDPAVIIGGICGYNTGTIYNCDNSGNISKLPISAVNHSSWDLIAGITGSNYGNLYQCFNAGTIDNGGYESGIVSYNSSYVTDCVFLDVTATGCINDNFKERYTNNRMATPEQMKQAEFYPDWDFIGVWELTIDQDFPVLRKDIKNIGTENYAFDFGRGTEESPYLITKKNQLLNIADYMDCSFRLDADIVFSPEDFSKSGPFYGERWLQNQRRFLGTFDGNHHTLSGMKTDYSVKSSFFHNQTVALTVFKYNSGVIKNLAIVDVEVTIDATNCSQDLIVGGIATDNKGDISGCIISGSCELENSGLDSYDLYFGGFATENSGSIKDCFSSLSLNAANDGNARVYIGGIAATNIGEIAACGSAGALLVKSEFELQMGGIASKNTRRGNNADITSGLINRCYFSGDLVGSITHTSTNAVYIGGIAGLNTSWGSNCGPLIISDCFNIGTITFQLDIENHPTPFNGFIYLGGIAGYNYLNDKLQSCYNGGVAEGFAENYSNPINIGGLAGKNEGEVSGVIADFCSPAIGQNTGTNHSVTKTVDEMKVTESYIGFDFTDTWEFDSLQNYAYPLLKNVPLVNTVKPVHISITTLPAKLSYIEEEAFEFDDMVIHRTMNNGEVQQTDQFLIYTTADLDFGDNLLAVVYHDGYYMYTAYFTITISPKPMARIDIEMLPEKLLYFVNESLDLYGAVLHIYYQDETERLMSITDNMVTAHRLDQEGDIDIAVHYYGMSTDFTVTVYPREIQTQNYPIDPIKGYLEGVPLHTKASAVLSSILQKEFAAITQNGWIVSDDQILGTGNILGIYINGQCIRSLKIVEFGDINGDGNATALDLLKMKRHILGIEKLDDCFERAGDINNDKSVSALDLLKLKRHILGLEILP